MANGMMVDSSLTLAQAALKGLDLRRDVIGQNIANTDTPGYSAEEVSFEANLQRALDSNGNLSLTRTDDQHVTGLASDTADIYETSARQGGSTRADGNNVDIGQELEQMTETTVSYQALVTAVTRKLSLLKTIAER
jgi:flagellar basal-body rod protein FlgB